jgi:hypothetical protein
VVVEIVEPGLADVMKGINSCILVSEDGIGKLEMLLE